VPRTRITSSAARERTTHLVCGSCKRKLAHVQTCLSTRVWLTQNPSDTLRLFRELNCSTSYVCMYVCMYNIWICRVGRWLDGWVEREIRRKGEYQHYLFLFFYFSFSITLTHSSNCSTFLVQGDGSFVTLPRCLCVSVFHCLERIIDLRNFVLLETTLNRISINCSQSISTTWRTREFMTWNGH
jgi:hypothetical protein